MSEVSITVPAEYVERFKSEALETLEHAAGSLTPTGSTTSCRDCGRPSASWSGFARRMVARFR